MIQVNIIFFIIINLLLIERHRRSKHEQEGRIFACGCGKSFLSQPALNNHKKTKHPELLEGQAKRGRGRPRKYPLKSACDFESTKYDTFFNVEMRKSHLNDPPINMANMAENVFKLIYKGPYCEKLFSIPETYEDVSVLDNLVKNNPISSKPKNERTCDDVFYEYLSSYKDKTNEKYFSLLIKFVILFKECYDSSKAKDSKEEKKESVTGKIAPEGLPDLCNEFYGEFLEPNNFFGIEEENRNEIIEIIQHFCIWLFKNEYTKSKLSLAS